MKSLKYKEEIFLSHLQNLFDQKILPDKYYHILKNFYFSYKKACENTLSENELFTLFETYMELLKEQFLHPHAFPIFSQKELTPFNYYQFGIDFMKPLINQEKSILHGTVNIQKIEEQIKNNENVILFANHQVESDPQALSVLLGKKHEKLSSQIIYIAGERVIKDPVAAVFARGCDILCIYSKKYIENPPEETQIKKHHNAKVMMTMSSLLTEGGKIIYVALSGGRDRMQSDGSIKMAPFDPNNLEMFHLMAKRSGIKTHFYPLSLYTYYMLPPPEKTEIEIGEVREANRAKIGIAFGEEIDLDSFDQNVSLSKQEKRRQKTEILQNLVEKAYQKLIQESEQL
jgi:glycerol-3-phosphate O-acyltransferase